jgi:hypothetical protein
VREHVEPPGAGRSLAIALSALAGIAVVWLLAGQTPAVLLLASVSIGGAGLVAWLAPWRPEAAFGVLFLLATLSRWTIELPPGTMRLEQPAIAAGLLVLGRGLAVRNTWRHILPIALPFMVYLAALVVSSVVYAPDRPQSLRMAFWTGLSMAGGLLAFALLSGRARQAIPWFRLAGGAHAGAGIVFATLFLVLGPVILAGPDPAPGIQDALGPLPKAYAFSWEANIYASLLGSLAPFAVEAMRSRFRFQTATLVVLVLLGMTLGLTRGAYIGLAAGLIAYAGVTVLRTRRLRVLAPSTVTVVGALVLGMFLAPALLPGGRAPTVPIDVSAPGWGRGFTSLPGGSAVGTGGVISPRPPIVMPPPPDTVTFRLDRVPVALEDWTRSPFIGLGANSFGERHADPSQEGRPDHIAILAVAALYDSGIVGFLGLSIGFFMILLTLWRMSRRPGAGPSAAMYMGALVCLLVAYQATNAIHFSFIWLLAGAAIASALNADSPEALSG